MKIYKLFLLNGIKEKDRNKSFKKFVEINKYKYKIIYKNKIYPLQSIFQVKGNKIGYLKIKLISYNHIKNIPLIVYDLSKHNNYKIEKFKKNMNMYKYIDYLLYSSHEVQKLIYKFDNEDKIKLFGEKFVENNEKKCSIIYKDNIIPFQSYFLIEDIHNEDKNNKKFEILLLELEDILDKSYMFHDCESLVEFSNFKLHNTEIKNNIIEEENYINYEEIGKYNNFYPNNIDEDIINKKRSNLSKETLNFFKLNFNKIDKVKRNYYVCLYNISYMFYNCY